MRISQQSAIPTVGPLVGEDNSKRIQKVLALLHKERMTGEGILPKTLCKIGETFLHFTLQKEMRVQFLYATYLQKCGALNQTILERLSGWDEFPPPHS